MEEHIEWAKANARRRESQRLNHLNGLAERMQKLIFEIKVLESHIPQLIRSRRSVFNHKKRQNLNPSFSKKMKSLISQKMTSLRCKARKLEWLVEETKELKNAKTI